jgi:hypothetical protein
MKSQFVESGATFKATHALYAAIRHGDYGIEVERQVCNPEAMPKTSHPLGTESSES